MPEVLVSQSEQEPLAQEALHAPRRYRFTPEQFHLLGKLGIFHNTREDCTVQLRYTLEETVAPLFKADWQLPVRSLFEG